jgi:hypothetical protein
MSDKKTGLELLREPFPQHLIGKLPKPTKAQNECPATEKTNCKVCGGWHHPRVIHLDYVGHAALTDRLLDCDPAWNWEPLGYEASGQPLIGKDGMWIKLTVCGISRLGFGDSGGKTGANAIKETIGDALRNAAMRFGAALDLWSKEDLHKDEEQPYAQKQPQKQGKPIDYTETLIKAKSLNELGDAWSAIPAEIKPQLTNVKDKMKQQLREVA